MARDKKNWLLVLGTVIFSLVLAVFSRFQDGIPTGIDSTSHLFKILFAYKTISVYGYFPSWCSDWYGGTPFLLFYPPLAYAITVLASFPLRDPLLAYKVVDAGFYAIAPFTVYLLFSRIGFTKREAALSALFYALSPVVMENYLNFDRFTTVVSIPVLCLFLTVFFRYLESGGYRSLAASSALLAGLMLIHHLTAYIVGIVAVLFVLDRCHRSRNWLGTILRALPVLIIALGLAAFWLIPFVESSSALLANPFHNKSVFTSFIETGYMEGMIAGLGLFQFSLTLMELAYLVLNLIFSFGGNEMRVDERATAIWFTAFFWLGLGFYGLLFRLLPFYMELDVLRFQLYLVIPQSILAATFLGRIFNHFSSSSRLYPHIFHSQVPVAPFALAALLFSSTILAVGVLGPVKTSEPIPGDIVAYYISQTGSGRILPIECPVWVYVLPIYTGKPLIDGWYPQEKIIRPLVQIDDYTINLLDMHPEERVSIWNSLIDDADRLGVEWVMIGDPSLSYIMENHPEFTKTKEVGLLSVYASDRTSLITLIPPDSAQAQVDYASPGRIHVSLSNITTSVDVLLKEADMDGWWVEVDGLNVPHGQNGDGFITFQVGPARYHDIMLSYERRDQLGLWVSATSLAAMMLLSFSNMVRGRHYKPLAGLSRVHWVRLVRTCIARNR